MNNGILLTTCVVALASCNKGPQVEAKNASAEEVAKKVQQAGGTGSFVNPGRWVSKVTIEQMTMPGIPAGAAAQMKSLAGQVQTHESCLTPEEVKQPKADFFAGNDKNCRYDHFTMAGGKIDAQMTCQAPGKGDSAMKMTMAGTYSGDAYQMEMGMTSDAGDALTKGMAMKMRVDANRVGQCTGKEQD